MSVRQRLPRIVAALVLIVLPLTLPAAVPGAAADPEPAPLLTVRLDSVTPDVITTSSDATLTVA